MNAPNLAICVAPVIVTSVGPASFVGTMESMGRAQALVRDLITQYQWFFEDEEEPAEENEKAAEEEEVLLTAGDSSAVDNPVEESTEVEPVASN